MPVSMLSTSLLSDRKSYSRFNALDTIYTPPTPGPGMVLMKPTSISNSSGTATLGTNGQITFSSIESVSLNGVFTADFDNYVISARHQSAGGDTIHLRLRASGSDASGASDYVYQSIGSNGTNPIGGSRGTNSYTFVGASSNQYRSADTTFIYGPFLAQATAFRSVNVRGSSGGRTDEFASTHALTTSYDGFTWYVPSSTITGALQVYGIRS